MTRRTNATIAGITFLAYIAAGLAAMSLFRRVTAGAEIAIRLAGIAHHATAVGALLLLDLVQCFSAVVLAVTLYAITREQDRDLAVLAMICRVLEGVFGGLALSGLLDLRWLARAAPGLDPAAVRALGGYLFHGETAFTAIFFAVGSTLFAWLMLRGRMIPVVLAWLGVIASLLLVVVLPLQLAGFLRGPVTSVVWLPMLAFEVPLALWLILKGAAPPAGAEPRPAP